MVAGVGNVGGIPETIGFGQAAQDAGRTASEDFNAALFGALPAGVATLDTIALFDAVLPNPAAFGLPAGINITDACLLAGGAPPGGALQVAGEESVELGEQQLMFRRGELDQVVGVGHAFEDDQFGLRPGLEQLGVSTDRVTEQDVADARHEQARREPIDIAVQR